MPEPLNDRFARANGFEALERGDGFSKVRAVPGESALNGADIVHGGYLFSLADYAFALASNTDDRLALSASASINYIAPCPAGRPVFASAKIVAGAGRGAVFDITIGDGEGHVYAVFQARASYRQRQ